jgi:hypothetical protein
MGLREIAEQDLGAIIEDDVHGFGWTISVTDPAGVNVPDLVGFSDDIAQLIDPDTGQAVSGRLASCALRISSLVAAGLGLPQGVADAGIKPWLVAFLDINGNAYTFKVAQSNPDRALGIVTCVLETYVP